MSADPLLPIAPARVKALVLPVGRIKRPRFASFVERFNSEHVVHLCDITPDGRPNRSMHPRDDSVRYRNADDSFADMFSPLAFPDGAIFYELVTHLPPPSHLALSPFDHYREPLVVIAVADGTELGSSVFSKRHSGGGRSPEERNIRNLEQDLEDLRDAYPKVLVHQLVIFDYEAPEDSPIHIPEGLATIPPPEKCKRTTMKTLVCNISSLLLAEMTGAAKSFEAMSYIESPGQSSSARHMNGKSWQGDDAGLSRRNSQHSLPTNTRSSSASGVADHRMSMPVPPKGAPFGSTNSSPGRPSTPVKSGLSNPPTTFDDMTNGTHTEPSSPDHGVPHRPMADDGFRTQSQDRVTVQGFGPGGLNERWRNKGKGRVLIVMGSLYLQAGRWTDALKELIEGAAVAKSINDHLWHGKALELIVICLLLLGWKGIEFTIPSICLPPADKPTTSATQLQEAEKMDPEQPKWLRNLQLILPDLLERNLALYSRISAEHLPPLPLAETTIRFCKILSALHLADGKLGDDFLKMVVLGQYPAKQLTSSPRVTVVPPRTSIVNMLFKAFPISATELLTTVDRIVILSGIASVLNVLGFQRKKAMVVRELVSILIGGLAEARTRGAAEVGIHPAAGLVSLNNLGAGGGGSGSVALQLGEGDTEQGMDAFLGLLLKTYGVIEFDSGAVTDDDSDASAITRIQRQSIARAFGMRSVKLNILRACINFSEALPDFQGVLKFSSDLLRTAGSGVAPGPRREDASPAITRDEQVRLATNISKTSNLSKRLGLGHLTAEYWDEFLLRGVKLEPLPAVRTPVEHKKSELAGASTARTSQDVDPFIHNPFLKQPSRAAQSQTLVAEEAAVFKLTLQNPFEVEVDVESVRLCTEGVEFESAIESTTIGAYRTQLLKISGTPKAAGSLHITGAIVKIRGCRERRFPIFPQAWAPEKSTKIKAIGLASLDRELSAPASAEGLPLKTEHLSLNVIAEQPTVVVKSTTLAQSSVMILEGERQLFSVTLENLSETTPADFLLFSFRDSTQEPLQTALAKRDATPAELYEYELILAKKQALRIRKGKERKRFIGPGETATFEFEILGKPGLTNGVIQVDYAYLGMSPDELSTAKFYTRQVSLQLTITVNASVEVARMDILPLHGSIPRPLWARGGYKDGQSKDFTAEDYCLLLLDLRNAWPSNMHVQLEGDDGALVEEHILPGNSSRVMVPLKRIYLEDPHAPIPALNPSRQRQFVVSTGKISPDMERANRESFWYREKILDSLKGTWKTTSGASRTGSVELRSMRLTAPMIEAIKIDEVGIDISVGDSPTQDPSGKSVAYVDEFTQVKVHITNRTEQPIYPTVRLIPALCHRPLNVALDFTRKIAWNGIVQQSLPLLEAKSSTDVTIGMTVLCRGEFEITASVEETRLWIPRTEAEEKRRQSTRPRSETETMMDAALGARERRVWHTRQPCLLMARDRE
ncbi:uncharacterized protein E0L32_008110 [Thyridium curvatum]|uniref:Hypercellular protein HypA n=1 Tax=Thyridium curvatum TaxID=1093900 RepID=A0A507AWU5_9PEZI|nr:uncharacterized protein E0L32_008110 [Thyridium curvatum]TPX10904.1 hypothetical protein E0L32_008110 [Thyridium curvatum]